MDISRTNRMLDLERVESKIAIPGDFEGNVTAYWRKLSPDGAGIVVYRDKVYRSVIIGTANIATGEAVELSHANGVYYSKY